MKILSETLFKHLADVEEICWERLDCIIPQIQNPQDMAHSRIYDRIVSMCTPVKIHGESMRKERARRNMDNFKGMLL